MYIFLKLEIKQHKCPCCGKETSKIHDYRKQKIKDIPAFGKTIYLFLNKRRYVCTHCKKRFMEKNTFFTQVLPNDKKVSCLRDKSIKK